MSGAFKLTFPNVCQNCHSQAASISSSRLLPFFCLFQCKAVHSKGKQRLTARLLPFRPTSSQKATYKYTKREKRDKNKGEILLNRAGSTFLHPPDLLTSFQSVSHHSLICPATFVLLKKSKRRVSPPAPSEPLSDALRLALRSLRHCLPDSPDLSLRRSPIYHPSCSLSKKSSTLLLPPPGLHLYQSYLKNNLITSSCSK